MGVASDDRENRLTPVFGVAFGWLLLDDHLSAQQGIGVALVVASLPVILLPTWRRGRHRTHEGSPHAVDPAVRASYKAQMRSEGVR